MTPGKMEKDTQYSSIFLCAPFLWAILSAFDDSEFFIMVMLYVFFPIGFSALLGFYTLFTQINNWLHLIRIILKTLLTITITYSLSYLIIWLISLIFHLSDSGIIMIFASTVIATPLFLILSLIAIYKNK